MEKTPFNSPPGLYFERMGPANLILNEWSLVIYYDMRLYWKEFDVIKDGITHMDNICNNMNDKSLCTATVMDFRHLMNEIQNNNEFLLYQTKKPNQKAKRGALIIVGNLANSLFGVLDVEYAEKMSGIIANLRENDDYLLELIKNQTSLIDATTNIMLKSQEVTEQQLRDFRLVINHTNAQIQSLKQESVEHQITQGFTLLAVRAILMLNNYQRIQSALLNVMIDTHHGKINPQLLTPKQFQAELLTIKEHLPPTLRLPAGQNDLLELYSLMTIQGRVGLNQIIFRLKLPLLSYDRFEMLHIVPVPILSNGTVMVIKPASNYLIINLHRDLYYPLTDQELTTCTMTSDSSYMCKQHHPLYRRGSNVSACELSFISHVAMPKSCNLTITSDAPQWIQLLNPNHWIYFRANKSNVNVVCGNNVIQTSLVGSGIIKLGSDCAIKEELTTSSFQTSFVPTRNITEFVIPASNPDPVYTSRSQQSFIKELQNLQEKLQQLKARENLPSRIQPHDVHQFTISYLGLFLVILISAFFIGKYLTARCKSKPVPNPIPQPRTTTAKEFRVSVDLEE